jgi:putative ABC transport system substrate-binding protein
MDRRRFLLTSLAGALAAPLAAYGQQTGKVYRIGMLSDIAPREAPWYAVFERRMSELGYVDGKNFTIEFRVAGTMDQLPSLAADLVRLQPDLILASGPEAARAIKGATSTVAVVFSAVEWDPIALGVVTSLRQPGGNFTGVAYLATELAAKRLELLREAVPRATRLAILWQRSRADHQFKAALEAAQHVRLQVISLELGDLPHDLEASFRTATQERADALLVLGTPAFFPQRTRLTELALRHRLPASFQRAAYAKAGGLMAFGADIDHMFRRLAHYADRVLKGIRPADLPVEQPTNFELVINLKTAKALGLTIPPSLLARADLVIE